MPTYPKKSLTGGMPLSSLMVGDHRKRRRIIAGSVIAVLGIAGLVTWAVVSNRNAKFNAWYEAHQVETKNEIFKTLGESGRTVTASDRANVWSALAESGSSGAIYDANRAALYSEVAAGEQESRKEARREWRREN